MLQIEHHGDVTRIVMSSAVTRAVGYTVSAFLVRGVLIDLGFPTVAREVAAILDRARPAAAIITHHHEDHAGNAALAARRGLPIAASDETLALLTAPAAIHVYRRVIWGTPPAVDVPVTRFESDALRLIATPGHSTDHHVVWDAERETLFAGDLFLGVKVRAAHHAENPRLLARSLRIAAALRPRRMFDAHRGSVADPVGALLAKAEWVDETIAAIESHIAAGWSDRAIARAILGREALAHYASRGQMSRINFVAAVRATSADAAAPTLTAHG